MAVKSTLNFWLLVAFVATTAAALALKERDVSRPNFEFLPETQMSSSAAYDSFAPNPNFPDGSTLRMPPTGTIARGHLPAFRYLPTTEDALRAGRELTSPFKEGSPDYERRLQRGTQVFDNICQTCHGPIGEGNGPVTQKGFPLPTSLLADRAIRMRDGQMFHVVTFGQGKMPGLAALLSPEDRWSAILHVRMLQGPYGPSHVPSRIEVAKLFRENCAACHGEDGTGNHIRKVLPMIPDFTSLGWQLSQTELALVNQIDYGSLPLMPSFRYKLPQEQILSLAVYVRSFAPRAVGAPVADDSHLTASNVYGTYCFACHDTNGKGNPLIRQVMPDLPDFTNVLWQKSRKDADFAQSILLGKGKFMLPMSDKLGPVDINRMVALVRDFQGGKQVVPVEEPKLPGPPAPAVVAVPTAPSVASTTPAPPVTGTTPPKVVPKVDLPLVAPAGETAARIRVGAGIFRQYCIVCHGVDGKGTQMRPVLPPIPDFTSPPFHKEHTDVQLMISILEGKGTLMPANRGRVTEDQVGDLVAFVRSFGPQSAVAQSRPAAAGTTAGVGVGDDSDFARKIQTLQEQWNALEAELQKTKRNTRP
jgi:mono/diheme cytochrome c family protein